MKYDRRKILKLTWALRIVYKMSFSEAQKLAWANTKLKVSLRQGSVQFSYKKKNGEIRDAIGTLHNVEHLFVGSDKFHNDVFTIRYYDLEKEDFRAMKMNSLISVNSFNIF